MADYVSKYTGSQVDGILDDAIELPQHSSSDSGKVLVVNSTGDAVWRTPTLLAAGTLDELNFLGYDENTGNMKWHHIGSNSPSTGDILTYTDDSGYYWDSIIPSTNQANDGDFLRYESNGGVSWQSLYLTEFIDTSNASGGEFLTYSGQSGIWLYPNPLDTTNTNGNEFLKNSSNSGICWAELFDTTYANERDALIYTAEEGIHFDSPIDLTYADNGKYLKYSGDSGIIWEDPLHTFEASDGSFLGYSDSLGIHWVSAISSSALALSVGASDDLYLTSANGGELEWGRVTLAGIDTSDANEGDILKIVNGTPTWTAP